MKNIIYGDERELVFDSVRYTIAEPTSSLLLYDDEVDPFIDPIIIYSDNNLSGGNAKYIAFGDIGNLTMKTLAETNSTPLNPETIVVQIAGHTINFGSDTLSFGKGNNVLSGDMQDALLSAQGAVSTDGSPTYAAIYENTFNYGDDIIMAGHGDNVVYGDMRDLTLIAQHGQVQEAALLSSDPTDLTPGTVGAAVDNNTFNFGLDTISLGDGNNIIYGDVRDINLTAIGPTIHTQEFWASGVGLVSPALLNFNGDVIEAGDGHNVVYGDFRDIYKLSDGNRSIGDQSLDPEDIDSRVDNNSQAVFVIEAEADHITLGDGNNLVFGDGDSMHNRLLSGQAIQTLFSTGPFGYDFASTMSLAGDHIVVGDGTNTVYGDLKSVTVEAEAELAVGSQADASAQMAFQEYYFGNDIIELGNGGNTVIGDAEEFIVSVIGGQDTAFSNNLNALIGLSYFSLGSDTISSGDGADLIYADTKDVSFLAESELAVNQSSFATLGGVAAGGTFPLPVYMVYGADNVNAGGGNDTIYGDAESLLLSAKAGTVVGEDVFSEALITLVTHVLGNDVLNGDAGNDTIYGDLATLTLIEDSGNKGGEAIMENNEIILGNDTITGGEGNDTLIGDLAELIDLADFQADNTLTFGADIFVYDGDIDNGNDVILDYSKDDGDILQSVHNAMFTDGGLNADGNLVVNVDDAGDSSTIVLVGVDSFADVTIVMI